jgi:hemerythrin-like domain-containing protein
MTTTSSNPGISSSPSTAVHGNIGPPLRTFTDAASAPAAHVRILQAVRHDHRELASHSHKILNSTDPDEQTRYQNQFTWELARHAIGEELVVYPAIAKHVNKGQAIADKNRAEHQVLKEQLKTFQGLPSTDPRFVPTLQALMEDLERHIKCEEEEDLVQLEDALSRADSEALTRSLDRTKMFVPSRSHPLAPSKPPFESAVGLITAPIDMLADMFRKWPHPGELEKGRKAAVR